MILGENGGNGNSDTGNGIKLQRRVLRNDACSTTIEQVFETDPNFGNRPEHASLVRSCSQEFLDDRINQQQYATTQQQQQQQTQLQQPRSIHMHQFAFPPSTPSQQQSPIVCSNIVTGIRHHSHKRRHPQATHDVGVGKDCDSDVKPESSWAKLELLASTSNLTGKNQAAAETRNERLLSRYERIDKVAMWGFRVIFFLFNVCYWSYYLLLDDVMQDLW